MRRALPRLRRDRERAPRIDPAAVAFQADLDALVSEPAPLGLRLWPALAGGMILMLLAVAAVARVDVVVTASGRLVPDVPPVVLQPMERAVLRELHVRPGDTVHAGQLLAEMDSTFTQADRDALEAQRRSLSALRQRLEAEFEGRIVPVGIDTESTLQALIQAERHAFHMTRRLALEEELRAIGSALRAEQDAAAGIAEQLVIAREVEAMRARLAEGQVGSRLNLLAACSSRLTAEPELRRSQMRREELGHRVAGRQAELGSFLQDWRRQVLEELVRTRTELGRVEEQLAKATRLDALTELRAPRDGVVLDVARRAPGSVVREGESLIVLVPSGVPLVAEVMLRSADIGRLQAGTAATLKVDAFPWRRHGLLSGMLRSVSRESYNASDAQGGSGSHRGHITFSSLTLRGLPSNGEIIPGMTVTADIKIGTRNVLEFFAEPILRGLSESLREP